MYVSIYGYLNLHLMSAIEINRASTTASTTTIIPTTADPSIDDTTTHAPITDKPERTTTETGSIIILYIFSKFITFKVNPILSNMNICIKLLETGEILAVSVDIIILPVYYVGVENEVDDTSYTADKPVFERIIADITNSSESDVESSFVEMISSITKIGPRIGRSLNWKSKRSNGNRALINVVVKPRHKTHEAYVVSKMNLSISLRDEINAELQNRPTENGVSVERVNPMTRKSGNMI